MQELAVIAKEAKNSRKNQKILAFGKKSAHQEENPEKRQHKKPPKPSNQKSPTWGFFYLLPLLSKFPTFDWADE